MPSFSSSYIHGQVTKIGPGRQAGNGASMAIQVQPGDGVKFREFAGSVVKLEGMYVCMYVWCQVSPKDFSILLNNLRYVYVNDFHFPSHRLQVYLYVYVCMYVCMYDINYANKTLSLCMYACSESLICYVFI